MVTILLDFFQLQPSHAFGKQLVRSAVMAISFSGLLTTNPINI